MLNFPRLLRTSMLASLAIISSLPAARSAEPVADSTELETIVVTAQRHTENIQEVPISIQAISGKEIQKFGIKSSSDLSALTPDVDIALPDGAGSQPIITIRGVGLNDYSTNNSGPNGVYVDEVYLSASASQSFQTFDLERVEVLKGPQGTLYGRNTSGGALNFITVKPTDAFTEDFHVEYSSFNTINLEAAIGGPITDGLDGRFAVVKNNSQGFINDAYTGGKSNGANNGAGRLLLEYKKIENLTVLLNAHGGYVDNRPAEYRHIGDLNPTTGVQCNVSQTLAGQCVDLFGYGTPPGFYDGSFNRAENLTIRNYGTSVRADYNLNGITLTSISAVEHNNKLHPEDSDASPNRLLEVDFGVVSTEITQEFRASQSTNQYDWVAGAFYMHENLKQNQPLMVLLDFDNFFGPGSGNGVAGIYFDNSTQITDSYAAYGQADYKLTNALKLTLGARYTTEHKSFDYDASQELQGNGINNFGPITPIVDSHQSLNDGAFSWRTALNYDITDAIMAYASAATGFKGGIFNGGFLSNVPIQVERQLEPIAPEKVTSYEVGLKSTAWDRRAIANVAAFFNDYKNMQIPVYIPFSSGTGNGTNIPLGILTNATTVHTEGVEFEFHVKPLPELTLTANAAILRTRIESFVGQPTYVGNQLALSPHSTISTIADYTIPLGGNTLNLELNANYKSQQYFDPTEDQYTKQDPYWLANGRVAYVFGRWETAAFVRNIADKHYFVDMFDLSSLGFIQGIYGTPRTFGVEVNYHL
jgi:iron complex outermembrane receptor protein